MLPPAPDARGRGAQYWKERRSIEDSPRSSMFLLRRWDTGSPHWDLNDGVAKETARQDPGGCRAGGRREGGAPVTSEQVDAIGKLQDIRERGRHHRTIVNAWKQQQDQTARCGSSMRRG